MIVETLDALDRYLGLHPCFPAAVDFLRHSSVKGLMPGSYALDSTGTKALVSYYFTKAQEQGKLEYHSNNIDIQYVVSGCERIGYCPLTQPDPLFDTTRDVGFIHGTCEFVSLVPGRCIILFPHDAHMPGINHDTDCTPVQKIVIKVPVTYR